MDHPQFVEHAEPEDVFTLVSDENRIAILRALWDSDGPLAFSDLRDATDIRDSGQFNYHLDKLRGQFVTKTPEGYELTAAGTQINGAIEAGSYTSSGTMEPIVLDKECSTCGSERTFHYEDERASVTCDSCGRQADFAVPPSTFIGCDRSEIPTVAARYLRAIIERLENGFCSQCDGPVEQRVCRIADASFWTGADDEDDPPEDIGKLPIVEYECRQCGMTPTSGLTFSLLTNPNVVSFYHEHDVDVRNRSLWEFAALSSDGEAVRQDDPFRASATFTAGDEELTVVVDEDLQVTETMRSMTQ
jgi:hypothetical protein